MKQMKEFTAKQMKEFTVDYYDEHVTQRINMMERSRKWWKENQDNPRLVDMTFKDDPVPSAEEKRMNELWVEFMEDRTNHPFDWNTAETNHRLQKDEKFQMYLKMIYLARRQYVGPTVYDIPWPWYSDAIRCHLDALQRMNPTKYPRFGNSCYDVSSSNQERCLVEEGSGF